MGKKVYRIIAGVMFVIACIFVRVAITHPELFFPWSNTVTFILYGIYCAVMALLFFASLKRK